MLQALLILSLPVLFLILGKAADAVVTDVRRLAAALKIPIFIVGLCLGALTTLPELVIGLNAIANDAPDLTLGNLLGGIVVLFTFVLGLAAVLNGKIVTNGRPGTFVPIAIYLFLPLAMAWDGTIEFVEGAVLMALYAVLLYHLFKTHPPANHHHVQLHKHSIFTNAFKLLIALIIVVIASNLVVRITLALLSSFDISPFFIGAIVFAAGTNLPEGIVTIRAWKRGAGSLSLSNIIGSAVSNPFVIGLFAVLRPLTITRDTSFVFLSLFTLLLLVLVGAFYKSGRSLTRREGILLLVCYAAFVVAHFAFSVAT